MQLPNDMDARNWGEVLEIKLGHGYNIFLKKKAKFIPNVIPQEDSNLVQILLKHWICYFK